ncbi:hypothetical protein CRV24_004022 [Beauveria bassiana]|nr:hypothetical protein CRV24_004022 [Beauveria bassiana]
MAPFLPPSRTVPLQPRQASTATTTVTVTSNPNNGNGGGSTLDGGAIAGIVIGSIVGFLLLVWIIRSCFNLGGPSPTPEVEPCITIAITTDGLAAAVRARARLASRCRRPGGCETGTIGRTEVKSEPERLQYILSTVGVRLN